MARRATAFLYGLSRALYLDPRRRPGARLLRHAARRARERRRPVRPGALARAAERAHRRELRERRGRGRGRVRGRRARSRPARAPVQRGICELHAPRGLPARAARRRRVAARALPRPDAGLQGSGAAAGGAALRACAERARRAHHGARRNLRRHRLSGYLRPRVVQPGRDRRPVPGGPRERCPAASDDDCRGSERARRGGRRHVRRLPADRQGAVRGRGLARARRAGGHELHQLGPHRSRRSRTTCGRRARSAAERSRSRCRPAISAMSSPAGSPGHPGCRSSGS